MKTYITYYEEKNIVTISRGGNYEFDEMEKDHYRNIVNSLHDTSPLILFNTKYEVK